MSTDSGKGTDPNQAYDEQRQRGKDHPDLSPDEAWGENQNPVRDTPQPFGNMTDGGSAGG